MRNGFSASVPARKPKTQIGRVLTELTSEPAGSPAETDDDDAGRVLDDVSAERARPAQAIRTAPPEERYPQAVRIADAHEAPRLRPGGSGVAVGRDRLAALRERLALAARPTSIASEPKHTAAAVRELVEELRARLAAAVKERAEIAGTLEELRGALAQAETRLERERRSRADIEALAEERGQVADEAVAEAEALAAERDLLLGELAERRRLEDEQTGLLEEAEAALDQHRAEGEATASELVEMRDLLDLRAAEIADLESRLHTETAARAKVEIRCREVEAEVARLADSTEALEAINSMIGRRR